MNVSSSVNLWTRVPDSILDHEKNSAGSNIETGNIHAFIPLFVVAAGGMVEAEASFVACLGESQRRNRITMRAFGFIQISNAYFPA